MSKPIDQEHNRQAQWQPFVYGIDVFWGHCDPANIVYTGFIPQFALQAIDAWWRQRIGYDWYAIENDLNMGTPFVHLAMDFKHPITPRHKLDCEVLLEKIGNTSLNFTVTGSQQGTLCFTGNFTCVRVKSDSFQPQAGPEFIQEKLEMEAYRAAETVLNS